MLSRHRCNDNYCDQSSDNNEYQSCLLHNRNQTVGEDAGTSTEPGNEEECDIGVPCFWNKLWMPESIELYADVGRDADNRCQVKDPTEKVEPASEETDYSAPFRTRRHRSPVVDTSSRGNGRSKLSDACSDESVVYAGHEKLVQNTRRTTVHWTELDMNTTPLSIHYGRLTDRDGQRASKSDPCIINGKCETANAQKAVVSVQLIAMS